MKIAIKLLGSVAAVLLSAAAFHAANASERPPPSGEPALRCGEVCNPATFNKCPAFCADPGAICNTTGHCEIPQ